MTAVRISSLKKNQQKQTNKQTKNKKQNYNIKKKQQQKTNKQKTKLQHSLPSLSLFGLSGCSLTFPGYINGITIWINLSIYLFAVAKAYVYILSTIQ